MATADTNPSDLEIFGVLFPGRAGYAAALSGAIAKPHP
jgi:hypothetical protein